MKTYNFTLVLSKSSQNIENLEDSLFEVGCDDATLSFCEGITYLEFDREENNFREAINKAISQVESIDKNITVVRIEPDDLVHVGEIARRINKSREFVHLLIEGKKVGSDFPAAISEISPQSLLWSWYKVAQWLRQNKMIDDESVEIAQYIADVNYALLFRQDVSALNRVMKVNKQLNIV